VGIEYDGLYRWVECGNMDCNAAGKVFAFLTDVGNADHIVANNWNTRPIEDGLRAELARLTAELEREKDNCGKFYLALEKIYDALGMDDHTGSCIPEIDKLQANNARLTAELAELRAENKSIRHILSLWKKTEAMKEIDRLTAELAEARTVLKSKEIIIDNQEKRINELAERLLKK